MRAFWLRSSTERVHSLRQNTHFPCTWRKIFSLETAPNTGALTLYLRTVVLLLALAWPVFPAHATVIPQRVVSLAPNVTELLFAIGAEDQLVGRSQYSNYPPEALRLPSVGSYYRPELESIVALRPDLCIAMRDGTPRATIERLEALRIPVVVLDIRTLEDVCAALLQLGTILGREEAARQAAQAATARLAALDARAAALADGADRPVILFVLQMSPVIAAGPDTYVGRLLARAGGLNPVHAPVPYPRLGLEEVVRARPQVILTADMGAASSSTMEMNATSGTGAAAPSVPVAENASSLDAPASPRTGQTAALSAGLASPAAPAPAFVREDTSGALWQPLRGVPALAEGRVYRVDADIFHRPSLRSLDALEFLIDCLHSGASAQAVLPSVEKRKAL